MKQILKLIYFNYFQIKNCYLSIISFIFFLILQPLILLILHFINADLLNYSLIIILIPLLFGFIFISILCFRLYSENKINNLEVLLVSQPIPKYYIYLSRLIYICILLGIQIVFNNLFNSIMLLIVHNSTLLYVLLISNSSITFFIELTFIAISVLISLKIKPNWYLITMFLLAIITCGISLITRPFIKNNDVSFSYNNPDIKFTKIINNTSTYYGINILDNKYLDINPDKFINNTSIWNYFIPSEWIVCFYNSLFNNFYHNKYTDSYYSLVNYELNAVNKTDLYFSNNNTIFLRPNDINLFSLDNLSGSELLFNTVSTIFKNNGFNTDPNKISVDLNQIKKCYDYNLLNQNYIDLLKDLLGINQQYSCLFYFTKYYYFLSNEFSEFKQKIIKNYNQQTFDFLDYIFSSLQTKYNLFLNSVNILNTNKPLEFYYPELNSINNSKPILDIDKEFILNDLIRFDPITNNVRVLLKKSSSTIPYFSDLIPLSNLNLDQSITNFKTYQDYINKISLRYDNTQQFLNQLLNNVNFLKPGESIIDFKLNNNGVSENQFDFITKLNSTNFLIGNEVFITGFSLLFLFLIYLSFSLYKNSNI